MDITFLAKADHAALQLEIARFAFETAKAQFESAKLAFEELLPQAEEHGIPRAKLKKLTEDRVRGLMESGMLESLGTAPLDAKRERPRKAKKNDTEKMELDSSTLENSATETSEEAAALAN